MSKAYWSVRTYCGICRYRDGCVKFERIQRGEDIDSGTLMSMANCPVWDPEKKEKEGEK